MKSYVIKDVDEDLWEKVKMQAVRIDETINTVIIDALNEYFDGDDNE